MAAESMMRGWLHFHAFGHGMMQQPESPAGKELTPE